jgi:hypothetical protein
MSPRAGRGTRGRRSKRAPSCILAAPAELEFVAYFAYRNSSDGQRPVLWVFIAVYAALLIGGINVLDSTVRRMARWMRRT